MIGEHVAIFTGASKILFANAIRVQTAATVLSPPPLSPGMVRRRSGKGKAAKSKPRGVDRKDSKINKWNKASDIPLDEEDQCTFPVVC